MRPASSLISGSTRLLAIFGDPIAQARSPELLNPLLVERGHDAVLIPVHVAAEGLGDVVAGLRGIRNFAGGMVTMPHKSAILPFLDELTPEARQAGSCNAIRRTADGRLVGTTFDGEGFVAGLQTAGYSVAGRRVFLVGSGGAASAIAFALCKHGATALSISNRTRAKAEGLVNELRAHWSRTQITVAESGPAEHDIAVNATSLGMKVDDPLPLNVADLDGPCIVADVVTHPEVTPLLVEAGRWGLKTHPGTAMLEAQVEPMIAFMLS